MLEAIVDHVRRKYNLLIGERTAESIKIELGSAFPLANPIRLEVRGRELLRGMPGAVTVTDTDIREALSGCVAAIVNAIRVALERTPPELSADIADHGIVLAGGGALLKNLDMRIRHETGLPVAIADEPLHSIVLGAGKMLDDFALLRRMSLN